MLRNIVITINNPLKNGGLEICDWLEEHAQFVIFGCETGEGGTFHWQGYAELKQPCRWSTIERLAFRWHIERRMGTQAEAIRYCQKDSNYVCHGRRREQGSRGDLDRIRGIAHEDGMRTVCMVGNLQQIRVAEKFLTYCEEPRNWVTEVHWLYGPSGCGKSRRARELCGEDMYTKNTGSKWWDGYDNHEYVIIDDFRDSWWPITYMLALLDRYEFLVEYKGGYRQFRAKTIIVTSINHPDTMYANTGECKHQLARRLKSVTDVSEVGGVILIPPD